MGAGQAPHTAQAVLGALSKGTPGPGAVVRKVESLDPGDRLSVTVPRFTVRSRHDLLGAPEVPGLDAVTAPGHLPGISPAQLAIEKAGQDALAAFQASGFKAAAVTVFAEITWVPPPIRYKVESIEVAFDRPFGFLSVRRAGGLVLVADWVAEPGT